MSLENSRSRCEGRVVNLVRTFQFWSRFNVRMSHALLIDFLADRYMYSWNFVCRRRQDLMEMLIVPL